MKLALAASILAISLGACLSATPMFTECPDIGLDFGCAIQITVNADGTATIAADPFNGPYEGSDDTVVGVVNNLNHFLLTLPLSGTGQTGAGIFDFDDDGICAFTTSPQPSGCPFDSTGYGGPGVTFTNIATTAAGGQGNNNTGVVNFANGVAPNGGAAYFSLEDTLLPSDINVGGRQGNQVPEPASLALISLGLAGCSLIRRRARIHRVLR